MLKRALGFAAAFIFSASSIQFAQTRPQPFAPRYSMPPKEIVEAFEAPVLPTALSWMLAETNPGIWPLSSVSP